ncbi:MAG: hypothetical protein QOD47_319 [Gemmatimonadaceae bacterium]|jgi:hypothetical protein|nr:hypothetical protein [Gemmatimonadaceae bacterium]
MIAHGYVCMLDTVTSPRHNNASLEENCIVYTAGDRSRGDFLY